MSAIRRQNAGLYNPENVQDEKEVKELYSQLNAIGAKINQLSSPEAKSIEQAVYDTYKNETSEINYIPLLGIGYSLTQTRGQKEYELTNHLGNVLATVSDKKNGVPSPANNSLIDHYEPDIVSAQDYYPFGMLQPGRSYLTPNGEKYRYGFNGKENDNEVKGEGNQQDYGMRVYDTRLGKFLSVDPLNKEYPWNSPYAFAENEPISNVDLDGLEKFKVTVRTFLPYAYVWEPLRSGQVIDKANTRWYPQYKNVEAHGGFKSQQQFNIDFDAGTNTYLKPYTPGTYSKNITTGKVSFFNNAGLGDDKKTLTRMYENRASIYAGISTKNPATVKLLPTPAIDYQLFIDVNKDGSWQIRGVWDGFPALEVFIEDLKTGKVDLMYFKKPSDAGRDLKDGENPKEIFNLFPGNGDVSIFKKGKIGSFPQTDKAVPDPKAEENKHRFTEGTDCKCGPEAKKN